MGRFRGRKGKGERYNLQKKKKKPQKAEEMTQQVGVLQEVLSISQNSICWFTALCNSSPTGSNFLFWAPQAPGTHMVYRHTWR